MTGLRLELYIKKPTNALVGVHHIGKNLAEGP